MKMPELHNINYSEQKTKQQEISENKIETVNNKLCALNS